MDLTRFASLSRTVAGGPSRRDVLRGLAGAGLGLGGLRLPDLATASKKRKRKNKAKPNTFGCVDVGNPCRRASQCCSGICEGKMGKKRCRAHDEGVCTPQVDFCNSGLVAVCNPNIPLATCLRTTGKGAFCGDTTGGGEQLCRTCSRDTDCQAEFGPGAACVVFDGICSSLCPGTGGTACVPSALVVA